MADLRQIEQNYPRMSDDGAIQRYIAQRRQRVDGFVAQEFSLGGTFARFRRTFVKDIARYPVNFLLSLPSLAVKQVGDWLQMAGWDQAARLLERIPLPLPMAAQAQVERAILDDLLELTPEDPRFELVQDPLKTFRSSRLGILDAVSSGLSLLAAYLAFGDSGLSPYAMGDSLARAQAKRDAASGFVLGSGIGSAFYSVFPPHPTASQVFGATAMVLLAMGLLGTLVHLFSDPLQQKAGVHRRQLLKLLNAFEDKLLLQAHRGEVVIEEVPVVAALSQTVPELDVQRPQRKQLRASDWLRKLTEPLARGYHRLEDRYGRRRAIQAIVVPALLLVILVTLVTRTLADPYREVRGLIADEAFPTAVARLDAFAKHGSPKDAEYWYWRGRALAGDHSYDASIDAYRTAMQRDVRYRDDSDIIDDLINAVAKTGNTKAKSLLLTENGPNAVPALIDRTVAREKIDRWAVADIAERLGAHDRLDYEAIALADLEVTTTCTEKKRTIQKIGEHNVTEALDELRELQNQPQWKCLEPSLKSVIGQLAAR